MSEIRSLTGLRGVAALWVIAFHLEFVWDPWNAAHVFVNHGYLGVDLFFILSGYIMARTYGGPFTPARYAIFLRKRFARTYPLFITVTLAAVAVGAVSEAREQIICGVAALIPNLLLIQSWGTPFCPIVSPSWSISTEWAAYFLFPLLWLCTTRWTRAAACIAAATVLLLSLLSDETVHQVGCRIGPLNLGAGETFFPLLRCFSEFSLGLIAYRATGVRDASLWVAALIIGLLCFKATDVPVVLLFCVLVAMLGRDRGPVAAVLGWRPIYFLGEVSYSIYMVHYPLIVITRPAVANLPVAYRNNVLDIIVISATLVLATACHYWIERPARRWLSPSRQPAVALAD